MFWLDTVILILLGVGAGLGAWTGLLKQVVRVVGFAVALYGSVFFHAWASNYLQQAFLKDSDPAVADALSYGVVFLAIIAAFFVTALLIDRCLKAVKLKWLDRLLGAGVGTAKGALILGAIFLAVISYPHPSTKEIMEQSRLAPILASGANLCLKLVPTQYTNDLQSGLDNLKQAAKDKALEIKEPPRLPLP
jgi:membrane protein required for colicin V production